MFFYFQLSVFGLCMRFFALWAQNDTEGERAQNDTEGESDPLRMTLEEGVAQNDKKHNGSSETNCNRSNLSVRPQTAYLYPSFKLYSLKKY